MAEQILHLQVDAVGPSEADNVALVSGRDCNVGGATDYVVFFADGGVGEKILRMVWENFPAMREASALKPYCARPSIASQFVGAQPKGRSHWVPESVSLMASPPSCSKRER